MFLTWSSLSIRDEGASAERIPANDRMAPGRIERPTSFSSEVSNFSRRSRHETGRFYTIGLMRTNSGPIPIRTMERASPTLLERMNPTKVSAPPTVAVAQIANTGASFLPLRLHEHERPTRASVSAGPLPRVALTQTTSRRVPDAPA